MPEYFIEWRAELNVFVKNARFAQLREDLLFCQWVRLEVN
jgi:hypothetical protein